VSDLILLHCKHRSFRGIGVSVLCPGFIRTNIMNSRRHLHAARPMWQQRRLLESWLANLTSARSRRNFEVTARRFLSELPAGRLRAATVEDVRDALARITADVSEVTGRQYVLRVKSLLGYAHRLGYAPFNAGATIRVRFDARNRGATFASRKTDVL
jgi:NAD(P)-dependent dehydrogenase (short-subunit alcohol dehydrogenase family)